jgi:hypothetical protein
MNIHNELIEIKKNENNEILNPVKKNNLKDLMDESNNFRIPPFNFVIIMMKVECVLKLFIKNSIS